MPSLPWGAALVVERQLPQALALERRACPARLRVVPLEVKAELVEEAIGWLGRAPGTGACSCRTTCFRSSEGDVTGMPAPE